jgi:hypothetical protein
VILSNVPGIKVSSETDEPDSSNSDI